MITAIVINEICEPQIRHYATDHPRVARDGFIQDWIEGKIVWEHSEFYGPNCTIENPAFSPAFLSKYGFEDEPPPLLENGVIVYTWTCITGGHGSDEHTVTGYFIRSAGKITEGVMVVADNR